MCNTCGCPNSCGNNGRNSNCGCCNLLGEFANAINNLFTDPCNSGCRCGCGCNGNRNAWRNGFVDGWNARGNNNGCGCCHHHRRSGCGCNGTADLSNLTDCGNFDDYYARQYGLTRSGCCCSL